MDVDLYLDEFDTLDAAKHALYHDFPGIPTEELVIVKENGKYVLYREGA